MDDMDLAEELHQWLDHESDVAEFRSSVELPDALAQIAQAADELSELLTHPELLALSDEAKEIIFRWVGTVRDHSALQQEQASLLARVHAFTDVRIKLDELTAD